ncbi:hypothetical protein E5676_scaffold604G00210 [Cucumis melo var. makuwa]|uniref:Uncharacterized protein n=1 Tax=Cucumis melo var. makuwa TaxID=1194695 RepID=A0A5D3DA50_CUCMM|nr:hypothetical protein E5676_scaffold604G00210 [Cucumis melo var. makuwa]
MRSVYFLFKVLIFYRRLRGQPHCSSSRMLLLPILMPCINFHSLPIFTGRIEFKADSRLDCMESSFTAKLSAMKKLLMVLVKNPYSTSGDTNDRNDCEEEGDKDGQIHEDHSVDVDGTHQADKDSVNER